MSTLYTIPQMLAAAPAASDIRTLPGSDFPYIPAEAIYSTLDAVFGPLAWSYEILSVQFLGERDCRIRAGRDEYVDGHTVLFQAHGRLTIAATLDGAEHILIRDGLATGSGQYRKSADPGKAHSDAIGEAATDALKRAARTIGAALGRELHAPSRNNGHKSQSSHASHSSSSPSSSSRRGSLAGTIRHHARALHGDDVGDYLKRTLAAANVTKIEDLSPGQQSKWADTLDQEIKSRKSAPSHQTLEVAP
jgi:hypothetical protein